MQPGLGFGTTGRATCPVVEEKQELAHFWALRTRWFGRLTPEAPWNKLTYRKNMILWGPQKLILQRVKMQASMTSLESSLGSQKPARVSCLQG